MSREHWEKQASNWAAWARTPNFDAYWDYSPAFFQLVPAPGRRTLEVGCGEGRVTRDLVKRGHRVIACDSTLELVKLATDADKTSGYLRCDAAALPFRDESFDLILFYNSLMDIDDMESSVREAARVLVPGGKMCACVTHPIPDSGKFESDEDDARFVIKGTYLGGVEHGVRGVGVSPGGLLPNPRGRRFCDRGRPGATWPREGALGADSALSHVAGGQTRLRAPSYFL